MRERFKSQVSVMPSHYQVHYIISLAWRSTLGVLTVMEIEGRQSDC